MAKRNSIAARVRCARAAAHIGSQRQLDRLAGLTEGHTALIERGVRPDPTSETLRKLAQALRVSIDWIVNGTGDGPSNSSAAA